MFNLSLTLEAQRQYYLESAGIRLWYARAPLPGAAASADFDFSEPDMPEVAQEERAALAVRPAPTSSKPYGQPVSTETARARLQGLMSETQGKSAPVADAAPVLPETQVVDAGAPAGPAVSKESEAAREDEVVESVQPRTESGLKVHWGIWPGRRHLLISERSADASANLQDELAQNILKALGDHAESALVVQWPVFNNAQVPGTDNAGLKRLLREILDDFGGRHVIALGLWSDNETPYRQSWFEELFGTLAVDSPHSVAALAAQARYKRELWLQLKTWQQGV